VPSGDETYIVCLQVFFATLELFYLAALENLHAGLNGVENGVEEGENGGCQQTF